MRSLAGPARRLRTLVAALAVAIAPTPAGAIDIILHYDDLGENPSWDPNGTQLMSVAHAAEHIWENLIPTADPNAHDIDVSWSQLDPGQLGLWKFDPFGNNNIYFDSSGTNWFIDPTPSSNSEFDFGDPLTFSQGKGSFLFGTTEKTDTWFDGATPPDTLEIGFQRAGISGSAKSDYDLLSAILHEMGHDLGVAGDILSGRYPIYPDQVSGVQGLEAIEGDCEGQGHC